MSTFQNAIAFFGELGIYDVVLPFLLVFTLVFAMLEKTRVLGMEQVGDHKVTKKNLNAMIAFVTGFLVIASSQLVRVINVVVANTALLLILIFLFLMVAGSFMKDEEFSLQDMKGWRTLFLVITFASILMIFLYAVGWLEFIWFYMLNNLDGPIVGAAFMLIIVVAAMVWLTSSPKDDKGDSKS